MVQKGEAYSLREYGFPRWPVTLNTFMALRPTPPEESFPALGGAASSILRSRLSSSSLLPAQRPKTVHSSALFLVYRVLCVKPPSVLSATPLQRVGGSQDLMPIMATDQSSISNDVDNDISTAHQWRLPHRSSPTNKSDTSVHEQRILYSATFRPDEYTPIIRMNRKIGFVRVKNISIFFAPPAVSVKYRLNVVVRLRPHPGLQAAFLVSRS
ncbi:hypothetical protein TNCV_851121 [Trichonephila clavipes]|nr:hypothetical protein TNCV_851121 [Trichonephila clavipes]